MTTHRFDAFEYVVWYRAGDCCGDVEVSLPFDRKGFDLFARPALVAARINAAANAHCRRRVGRRVPVVIERVSELRRFHKPKLSEVCAALGVECRGTGFAELFGMPVIFAGAN